MPIMEAIMTTYTEFDTVERPFAESAECRACGAALAGKQVVCAPVEYPDDVFCDLACARDCARTDPAMDSRVREVEVRERIARDADVPVERVVLDVQGALPAARDWHRTDAAQLRADLEDDDDAWSAEDRALLRAALERAEAGILVYRAVDEDGAWTAHVS